jgi:hypothetical protein
MTTDLIDRIRQIDPIHAVTVPESTDRNAVAMRDFILGDDSPVAGLAGVRPGRRVRYVWIGAASVAAATVAFVAVSINDPSTASAALTAAIDATTEASSGRISMTLTDLESNTPSALSVQFDHGDYMVSADAPALPMLEDFEVLHIDGTTFGAEGGGVWRVIMPPTDTFDATRILDEQNAALSALAGLQACADDANAFCGTVNSASLVDQLMLVDLNVTVVSADVRVTVADGFVDRVDLHVVRQDGDPGLDVVQSYTDFGVPQNIAAPEIAPR